MAAASLNPSSPPGSAQINDTDREFAALGLVEIRAKSYSSFERLSISTYWQPDYAEPEVFHGAKLF